MVFIGREREIGWMRLYLEHEANKILAVTGKANCGKTALMQEVMKRLAKTQTFFYLDLRKLHVASVRDFLEVVVELLTEADVHLTESKFKVFLGPLGQFGLEKKEEEAGVILTRLLRRFEKALLKVKRPVIVIDELQVLKELYVNGEKKLIDRLMEFFISLTKHQHLAHVIVLTSDSTFYAELYSKSGMHERMDFKLLDELSRQEAIELIRYYVREYSLSLDADQIYHYTGGNPSLIQSICFMAADVGLEEAVKKKLTYLKDYIVMQKEAKNVEIKEVKELTRKEATEWVDANVLFYNVETAEFEFQHRMMELAWNELLGES